MSHNNLLVLVPLNTKIYVFTSYELFTNANFILLSTQPIEQTTFLSTCSQLNDFLRLGITLDCARFWKYFSIIIEKESWNV